MRTPRLFIDCELQVSTDVELSDELYRHIHKVLRLKTEEQLTLFNGRGIDFIGIIAEISKRSLIVHILDQISADNESPVSTHLYQAISKGDRMDNAIQKSVELGVTEITPIISDRTVVRIDQKRMDKKQLHWKKIIIGACEQSGRAIIPTLHPVCSYNDAISSLNTTNSYVLSPYTEKKLSSIDPMIKQCNFIVGPEGGFSDEELSYARKYSVTEISAGKRILRTETAPIVMLAAIQTLAGDY